MSCIIYIGFERGEKMITVYADVLFFINFIMVFFVFLCVRLFLKVKRNILLCFLGSLFAGLGYTLIAGKRTASEDLYSTILEKP